MNDKYNRKYYIAFLIPSLFAIIVVILIPFITGIYTSLTNSDGFNSQFIGFDNYRRLLNDVQFKNSLWLTVRFSFVSVILINLLGLGFALLVTQRFGRITTFFRTAFFTPNLIGGLILGFIWQFIFIRGFESIARVTDISFFSGWLADSATGFLALVIVFLWQMSGYIMLIYIAFLSNIPRELYEAAEIDGASPFQSFRHITLPQLAPAFTVTLFLTLSNAFKIYDQNLALTGGGPFNSTEMLAMNIYNTAFQQFQQGYAQSKAVIFFLLVALISIIQLFITRRGEADMN